MLQKNVSELEGKQYCPYSLGRFNSGMLGLFRLLKLPHFSDKATGLLYVFPNYRGGFQKHPRYQQNLQERMRFIEKYMKPNQFLVRRCKKHLEDYQLALMDYPGYTEYYEKVRLGSKNPKAATVIAEKVAGAKAERGAEQELMTMVNAMNAEVEYLHLFQVLKARYKDKLCFKTLLVRDSTQKEYFQDFCARVAEERTKLKDEVLQSFTTED